MIMSQGEACGVSLHGGLEAENNSIFSCEVLFQAEVVGPQVSVL